MKVLVRFFATFREFYPTPTCSGPLTLDIDPQERVGGLIHRLRLPDAMPKIILVNGVPVTEEHDLRDGDVVSIFPPLIGGL